MNEERLRIRADELRPGDYLLGSQRYVLRARYDYKTERVYVEVRPSKTPSISRYTSFGPCTTVTVMRPVEPDEPYPGADADDRRADALYDRDVEEGLR